MSCGDDYASISDSPNSEALLSCKSQKTDSPKTVRDRSFGDVGGKSKTTTNGEEEFKNAKKETGKGETGAREGVSAARSESQAEKESEVPTTKTTQKDVSINKKVSTEAKKPLEKCVTEKSADENPIEQKSGQAHYIIENTDEDTIVEVDSPPTPTNDGATPVDSGNTAYFETVSAETPFELTSSVVGRNNTEIPNVQVDWKTQEQIDRVYIALCDEQGSFSPLSPADTIGAHRIEAPCVLSIMVPHCEYLMANPKLQFINGTTATQEYDPVELDDNGSCLFEVCVLPKDAGACQVRLSSVSFDDSGPDLLHSASAKLVVIAPIRLSNTTIRHNQLNFISIMPRNLGRLEDWEDRLLNKIKLSGYNAIHLTPVQELGVSGSSYSLFDLMQLGSYLFEPGAKLTHDEQWDQLAKVVKRIESENNVVFTVDIVLNHLSRDAPLAIEHPSIVYNQFDCPWLNAAVELDDAIMEFSRKIACRLYRDIDPHLKTAAQVDDVVCRFRTDVLNPFRMVDWFSSDDEARKVGITSFNAYRQASSMTEKAGYMTLLTAMRRTIGIRRFGVTVTEEDIFQCADIPQSERDFKEMFETNLSLIRADAEKTESNVMNSIRGILEYEVLERKRGPVTTEIGHTLVPNYFTTMKKGSVEYKLANNGWVMDWDATRNFAGQGETVYLGRQLCVWSDCIKLNFGETVDDSPVLFEKFREYVSRTAKVFAGIRLDNCHSTPIHVSKYLMAVAREIRPDIYIYGELFTNSVSTDCKFDEDIGFSSLIREAQHIWSIGDFANTPLHYGVPPLGQLKPRGSYIVPQNIMRRYSKMKNIYMMTPSQPPALLYDQTHDGDSQFNKVGPHQLLANAALCSASDCAIGSTVGCDEMIPHYVSVVDEIRCLQKMSETDDENTPVSANDEILLKYVPPKHANKVYIAGSFNNWQMEEGTTQGNTYLFRLPRKTLRENHIYFKFIIDGSWKCSDAYVKEVEPSGNANNVIYQDCEVSQCGLGKARKALMDIHTEIAQGGYEETDSEAYKNLAVFTRRNSETGDCYCFIIATAFDEETEQYVTLDDVFDEFVFYGQLSVDKRVAKDTYKYKHDSDIHGVEEGSYSVITSSNHETIRRLFPVAQHENTMTIDLSRLRKGSVIVVKTVGREFISLTAVQENAENALNQIQKSLGKSVTQQLLSYAFYSSNSEELALSNGMRGLYQFRDTKVYFAGLSTPLYYLENAYRSRNGKEWKRNAVVENMLEGNWLWEFHIRRLEDWDGSKPLIELMKGLYKKEMPLIRAQYLYTISRAVFDYSVKLILESPSTASAIKRSVDPLVHMLVASTYQLYRYVRGSPLVEGTEQPSLAAGLPHFASGYMRAWGRDTFLALPGCMIVAGRIDESIAEVLGFARVIRHANVPNLLDSGVNSRFNARDATWYFLRAVRLLVGRLTKEDASKFLNTTITLKWHENVQDTLPGFPSDGKDISLMTIIHYILSAHRNGIEYREWNAGPQIDDTMTDKGFNIKIKCKNGLLYGGNEMNCGTWMDKMGSSAKSGNRGYPRTPRDGAPIEMSGILGRTLKWVTECLIPNEGFPTTPYASDVSYTEWCTEVANNFHNTYIVEGPKVYYKDTDGATPLDRSHDMQLRCNWPVGVYEMIEHCPLDKVAKSLKVSCEELMNDPGQLGIKTLSYKDPNYRARYNNADDGTDPSMAHGASYHQGPEWLWPLGFYLMTSSNVAKQMKDDSMIFKVRGMLKNVRSLILTSATMSIPELTQGGGEICDDSCWSQAWSVGTVLEYLAGN